MHPLLRNTAAVAALFVLGLAGNACAQDESPVRISFDRESARTDIVTGRNLPDYTMAQRGSVQFFNGRLDSPERGFWYFFDGRRFQQVDRTLFIRKLKYIGTWVIAGTRRWGDDENAADRPVPTIHPKTNCEIGHHAVSFIPLNPATNVPEPRVHVLLTDLELMQWKPYDHWLVTDSQEVLESKQGTVY